MIDQALGLDSTGFVPVILLDSQMRRQPCEDYYWKLQFGSNSGEPDLTKLLEEILALLDSGEKKFDRDVLLIKSVDIFCMISSDNGQGGSYIKSSVFARLAKLDIDLIFDFYS